jgi:hypothetical protein
MPHGLEDPLSGAWQSIGFFAVDHVKSDRLLVCVEWGRSASTESRAH